MAYPEFLDQSFLGNTVLAWLIALAVFLLTASALFALRSVVAKRFSRVAARTTTGADDVLVDLVRRTRFTFLLLTALVAASLVIALPAGQRALLWKVMVIVLLVQGALWGNGLIGFWARRYAASRGVTEGGGTMMIEAAGYAARMLLWSVMVLLVLDNLGIDVTALIAGLGIGGIAVALAVQNILGDLLGALSIVLDKPFVVGDFIVVDTLAGTVEHVGLKTTRIRSLSGERLVVANADLLTSRIRNFQGMQERRVVFGFGVVYETDADMLAAIPAMVREIIATHDLARVDRVHFMRYGESSLDFEVVYFVRTPEYNIHMDILQAVNLAIYRRFSEAGIEFAYPTRTLYVSRSQRSNAAVPTLTTGHA
ncbi:MAG: mechanosensitive ion channel family protein [Gemmatimonadaceae bacterium]